MFNLFKRSKILTFKDLNFEEEEFSQKSRIALNNKDAKSPEIIQCLESSLNHYTARIDFCNGYFISVKLGSMFYSNGKNTYEVYSNLDRDAFGHLTSEEVTEYMIKIQKSIKGNKVNKYNFKYLEENKVAVKIPTLDLVHDFLDELAKYRNSTIINLDTHGLEYFETDKYFMLYEEETYNSCSVEYVKEHDYKIIKWDDIICVKQENKIDEYIDEQTRKVYVYQYCIMSGVGTYNTGFVERFDKISSSKEAQAFKRGICEECGLDSEECSLINLNIIGERDE